MRNSKNRLKITFAMLAALTLLPSCDSKSTDSELNARQQKELTKDQAKSLLESAKKTYEKVENSKNPDCVDARRDLIYEINAFEKVLRCLLGTEEDLNKDCKIAATRMYVQTNIVRQSESCR
jgi:hypothetical protein